MRNRVHAFRRVEGSGLYTNECTVIHESKEEEVSRERERGRKGTRYPKGGHERAGRHRYIGAHGEATSRVHLDLRLVCSATCASLHVTFLTSAPTCSPLTQVARATGSEQIRTPVNCPAATEDECRWCYVMSIFQPFDSPLWSQISSSVKVNIGQFFEKIIFFQTDTLSIYVYVELFDFVEKFLSWYAKWE